MKLGLLAALLAVLGGSAHATWDETRLPWSAPGTEFNDWTQRETSHRRETWEHLAQKNTPAPEVLWLPSLIGSNMLWAYQHSLSGKTGSQCPFYPSCSRYSRIAVETYGLTLGVMMTAERFSRCHAEANKAGQYPFRNISGHAHAMIWNPPVLDAWWKESAP